MRVVALAAALLLASTCLARNAAGQLVPLGPAFQVNTFTADYQSAPAVAAGAAGGFVVAWNSYLQDGQAYGVFAQRFTSAGTPAGGELQANAFTASDQAAPAVAALPAGGFVIAWQAYDAGDSAPDIRARRFDGEGTPLDVQLNVNAHTLDAQIRPAIGSDADGRFVVVWTSEEQDGDGSGIFARRFASDGTGIGSEFQVNGHTAGSQSYPSVGVAPGGSFVVAWLDAERDGSEGGIFARRFASDGAAAGTEFQVNVATLLGQREPAVAVANDGRFVVVWRAPDQLFDGVFARLYEAGGEPLSGDVQLNAYTTSDQRHPHAAFDESGEFVAVWTSGVQDGSGDGIFGRRFASDGTPVGGEVQLNSYATGVQREPVIAAAGPGRFVVAWESDAEDGSSTGVRARLFAFAATPTDGEIPADSPTAAPTAANPTDTATASATVTATPAPASTPSRTPPEDCPGDCNGDGVAAVNELIVGVNIALGNAAVPNCLPVDVDRNGRVTIDELIRAVASALNGC